METLKTPEFKASFFEHIVEVATKEGFTSPKWKKGASNLRFSKNLSDGVMTVSLYLDNKYLPKVWGYFHVYYPSVNDLLFNRIGIEQPRSLPDKQGWRCASNKMGDFLSEAGLLEKELAKWSSFELSEKGLNEAVTFVQRYYFEQAARTIASNTDTMVNMDALINGHLASLGYPDEHICLPYFMYTPFQAITGTVLACMFMREDRQRLAQYHVEGIDDWSEEYQYVLTEVVNYYVDQGVLEGES